MIRAVAAGWLAWTCLAASPLQADEVHESTDGFVARSFYPQTAQVDLLWLDEALRSGMASLLGHEYAGRRLRYWHHGERSAWVLEEVGMKEPITIGVTVEAGRIVEVAILVYRESRGGEVADPAFLAQFRQLGLTDLRLDGDVDGITGATLSVASVRRVAALALWLHQQALGQDGGIAPADADNLRAESTQ